MDEKIELITNNPGRGELHQLFLMVTMNGDYSYSNLYVRLHATSPSGKESEFLFPLELMDAEGNWFGESAGNGAEFEFPLSDAQVLSETGDYQFTIEPYMLDRDLCGVKEAGLRMMKTEAE